MLSAVFVSELFCISSKSLLGTVILSNTPVISFVGTLYCSAYSILLFFTYIFIWLCGHIYLVSVVTPLGVSTNTSFWLITFTYDTTVESSLFSSAILSIWFVAYSIFSAVLSFFCCSLSANCFFISRFLSSFTVINDLFLPSSTIWDFVIICPEYISTLFFASITSLFWYIRFAISNLVACFVGDVLYFVSVFITFEK